MDSNPQQEPLKAVEAYIQRLNTWFVVMANQDSLEILSRQYGNVGEGKPGEKDLEEARAILTRLRNEFPDFDITPLVTNEWVSIDVRLKEPESEPKMTSLGL